MSADNPAEAQIQRGRILLQQQRYKEAEEFFRNALAGDPHDPEALYLLAICQTNQPGSEQAALETINAAISIRSQSSDLHAAKSHILSKLDRDKEALASANEAVSFDPDNVYALNAKTAALIALCQWAEAEATARRALSIDADDDASANMLAHTLRMQNKLQENAAQVQGMLARDPENAGTHANAGWAALQRGDRKKAEEHFLEALRIEPGLEAARLGLLEAFKSRSPVYRVYLNYTFFMQRMTTKMRWVFVIGLYLGYKFLAKLFTGPLVWIGAAITVLYLTFVLWVHFARGVGNLLVLLDRSARHALTRLERSEAIFVGGGVLSGTLLLVAGMLTGLTSAFVMGIAFILASLPLAYTITNKAPAGRWLFGGFAAFIISTGLLLVLHIFNPHLIPAAYFNTAVPVSAFMAMGTTWLCGLDILHR